MAKITFVLDGSDEFARRELGAFLREDGEALTDRGEMTINFSEVDEALARWLISSLSGLHGLTPDVPDKAGADLPDYDNAPSSPRMRARNRADREASISKSTTKARDERLSAPSDEPKPEAAPAPTPAPAPAKEASPRSDSKAASKDESK